MQRQILMEITYHILGDSESQVAPWMRVIVVETEQEKEYIH
jgi:hypothetical protein